MSANRPNTYAAKKCEEVPPPSFDHIVSEPQAAL
jgi:hypothetical protein